MSEMLTETEVPEYPMEREASCPFAPPARMLNSDKGLWRVKIWNGDTPWLITGHEEAKALFADARISVDDAKGTLRTGMFVEAEIIAAERDTLAVPVTAIGSTPEGSMVMRVKDGVVERVAVRTGIRDGGLVEITEGLAEGDRVVTKAGAFVRDGDRINPIPAATN